MAKRIAQIEGNLLPFKVANGQVYIAGEKLNDLIINQFGKDVDTVYLNFYIEARKPQLIFHHPRLVEEAPEVDETKTLNSANESEEN